MAQRSHVLTFTSVAALGLTALVGVPPVATASPGNGVTTTTAQLSVGDVVLPEPGAGQSVTGQVPLVLDRPASADVRLRWEVVAGSAGSADLGTGAGTGTLRAGRQTLLVPVTVRGDGVDEPVEQATVRVSVQSGPVSVADPSGEVAVRDAVPGLSLGEVHLTEPDEGAAPISVLAVHVPAVSQRLSFRWRRAQGFRSDGEDITPSVDVVSIPRKASGVAVPVSVVGDTTLEFDESWIVEVMDVEAGTTVADGAGEIWLPNDDPSSWDTSWQPPSDVRTRPGSVMYVTGAPDDYITLGQTHVLDSTNARFVKEPLPGATDTEVPNWAMVSAYSDEDWSVALWTDDGAERLVPGVWKDVTRFPFAATSMELSGDHRGCNWLYGWFAVDQARYDEAGELTYLEARLEQRCEFPDAPPAYAYLRWDATAVEQPPPPGDPADLAWRPPAGVVPATGPYLYTESDPDNGLTHGATSLVTPETATTSSVTSSDPRAFRMHFETDDELDMFTLEAVTPDGTPQFVPALYEDIGTVNDRNPLEAGVELVADYTSCAGDHNTLAVDRAVYDDQGIQLVEVRFLQPCGGMLRGSARWVRPGS